MWRVGLVLELGVEGMCRWVTDHKSPEQSHLVAE